KDIFYLVYTVIMTPTGDVTQSPHALRFGNIVFDLSAFFNHNLLPGYRFPAPVTLELVYDPAMLGGLSESTLELFYWDGAAWSSDGIALLARDTANQKITISLAHLSELAVFGSAPTALEPGDEPTGESSRIYLPVVALDGDLSEMVAPVSAAPPAVPVVTPPTAPESAPEATSDEAPPVAESVTPEETPASESETRVDTPTPESTPAETPAPEGITPEETPVPESEPSVETPLEDTGANE